MIHIRPISSQQVEIEAEGQHFGDFHPEDATEAMEKLAVAYPGQVEVLLKANGFRVALSVLDKALELADLDGFQAAKQQATGKVVF